MVNLAKSIFRDFVTDGVPASGKHKPVKAEIREWGTALENASTPLTKVRLVDTVGLDPTTDYEPDDIVDGKTLAQGDLVLRAVSPADAQNGVYRVPASGPAVRHFPFASYDVHSGALFSAIEGTVLNVDALWRGTSAPGGTLGTTAIAIERFQSLSGRISFTGILTPTQITADQNDYAPTDWTEKSVMRLSSNANRNITGWAAGSDGQILLVENTNADLVFRFQREHASSSAANRFLFEAVLVPGGAIAMRYDGTAARWRLIAQARPHTRLALSPVDFGAEASAAVDSTDAFAACTAAAKFLAGISYIGVQSAVLIDIPKGDYRVNHWNLTGLVGAEIVGQASQVRLVATNQVSSMPIVDLSGCLDVTVVGIIPVGQSLVGGEPSIKPSCGFLVSATDANNDSNYLKLLSVGSLGWFSGASLVLLNTTNIRLEKCGFQNADPAGQSMFAGVNNTMGITSPNITIGGAVACNEIMLDECEFHTAFDAGGLGVPLLIDGVETLNMIGGVLDTSGSNSRYVRLRATNSALTFHNVKMFSTTGNPAQYGVFAESGVTTGLVLINPKITTPPSNAFFKQGAGAIVDLRTLGFPGSQISGDLAYLAAEQNIVMGVATGSGLATGATRYFGPQGVSGSVAVTDFEVVRSGVIVGMRVRCSGQPGAGQSYTFTVQKGGADQSITTTIANTAQTGEDITNALAVARGDRITVKGVASASAVNSDSVIVTLGFVPTS